MDIFMLVVKSKPMVTNEAHGKILGANVHVWVITKDMDNAKKEAFNYIEKYHWHPIKIEHEFSITPEHLKEIQDSERILYHKALQHGIAGEWIAWVSET